MNLKVVSKLFVWLLCAVVCAGWFGVAKDISLESFGRYTKVATMAQQLLGEGSSADQLCVISDEFSHIRITPKCFIDGRMPELGFQESIDLLHPYIINLHGLYDVNHDEFVYESADLEIEDALPDIREVIDAERDGFLLKVLGSAGYEFRIPKIYFVRQQTEGYSFYASVRDTLTYGPCRKRNYDEAMKQLDRRTIAPGETFNYNRVLANLPSYCMGNSPHMYLFYQWVCGGSTQLFWNALVNPQLFVTKRYAHSQWYEGFYGSKMGDDASLYEWMKQFEMKNVGDKDIYMRTVVLDDGNTLLFSAYPEQNNYVSKVTKEKTGPLKAVLSTHVTDSETGEELYEQEWTSYYIGINRERDL